MIPHERTWLWAIFSMHVSFSTFLCHSTCAMCSCGPLFVFPNGFQVRACLVMLFVGFLRNPISYSGTVLVPLFLCRVVKSLGHCFGGFSGWEVLALSQPLNLYSLDVSTRGLCTRCQCRSSANAHNAHCVGHQMAGRAPKKSGS